MIPLHGLSLYFKAPAMILIRQVVSSVINQLKLFLSLMIQQAVVMKQVYRYQFFKLLVRVRV